MNGFIQDIRYALRQLRRSPGFTLTAVLTLALGIGATTAIFSVFDAVVLKPLGYRDSGKLVVAWERVRFLNKQWPYIGPNPRHFDMWQKHATSFSDLALVKEWSLGVTTGTGHPRFVGLVVASPNLLTTLDVQPVLGRNFNPEDATDGHQNVVIISWGLWQSLFNGDRNVLGRALHSADSTKVVIGVLPKGFSFPKQNELSDQARAGDTPSVEVITPLMIKPQDYSWFQDYGNFVAIGRLKPAVTVQAAEAELNTIAGDIVRQVPAVDMDGDPKGALAAYVEPLKEAVLSGTSMRLWLLLAAVLSVQLIACMNLANAQLARAAARETEFAVRSALGASRWKLLRSLFTEICILSIAGGALGIALASALVANISRFTAVAIPRMGEIEMGGQVLGLALFLTCGSMLLFGSLPAFRLLRVRPQNPMQRNVQSVGAKGGRSLRNWLIGVQVCGCTVLLLTTGLFAKSLLKLLTEDKGFSTQNIVTASVKVEAKEFTSDQRIAFDDAVLSRLRSLPGVESAALVSAQPLNGESWLDGVYPGASSDRTGPAVLANYRWISPGYFATVQQRIVAGRDLDDSDRTQKNAVITEATARATWPGRNALGQQFRRQDEVFTVVGIVADARINSLRSPPASMVYLPYWNKQEAQDVFMVRGAGNTDALMQSVRKVIWAYDPGVTIANVSTLRSQANDSVGPERLETILLGAFGSAALLLALIGIYGTLSYSIAARTREIGLRMALGATRESVYLLTLNQILMPLAVGLGVGWFLSVAIGKSLSALLFDTAAADATVTIAVLSIFAVAAAAATFLPCMRAASIEPMQALRAE